MDEIVITHASNGAGKTWTMTQGVCKGGCDTRDRISQREGANTKMRDPRSIPKDTVRGPTPDTRNAPNITLPNAGGTISYCSLTSRIARWQ
jgi:hypothetical protein